MKLTILDKSRIKYSDHYLVEHQTYNDIDDKTANELIQSGEAKQAAEEVAGVSFKTAPLSAITPKFDKDKNGGYVAEAKLSEKQKKDLEEKGEATADDGSKVPADETPVIGKDNTLPTIEDEKVEVKQKVYDDNGKELTEEEIKARESANATGADTNSAKVAELQNNGQEVK